MTEPHPHAAAASLAKQSHADSLGLDTVFIDRMVERFYARVRADAVLGPIFAARVHHWGPHLARMKQFWGVILRGEGRFSGSPMRLHADIPGIDRPEFDRWLVLFREAIAEIERDPLATAHVAARAHAIAESLLAGVRAARGAHLPPHAPKGEDHVRDVR